MTVWHELWRWLVVAFTEIINTEEKLRKNKLNSFDKIRGRYVLNLLSVFIYLLVGSTPHKNPTHPLFKKNYSSFQMTHRLHSKAPSTYPNIFKLY